MNGTPSIGADGTLYFGVHSELFALNADGSVKWTFTSTDGWFYGEPAVAADGSILDVALGTQPKLYAISKTGDVLWTYSAPANPLFNSVTSPSVGPDGLVFFAVSSGPEPSESELFAVKPGGTLAWSTPNAGIMPAIGPDETVYTQSSDLSTLQALGPGGQPRWTVPIAPASTSVAIGDDGTVFVAQQGDSQVATAKNTLTAISATGKAGYEVEFAYSIDAPPLAIGADDTTYMSFAQTPGMVLAVSSSGSTVWQALLAGSGPATANGPTNLVGGEVPVLDGASTIYVGTSASGIVVDPCPCGRADLPPDGAGLQAFRADGSSAWTLEPSIAFGSPSMGTDGTLYAATVSPAPSGGPAYAVVAIGD